MCAALQSLCPSFIKALLQNKDASTVMAEIAEPDEYLSSYKKTEIA
jgi:hypothetical protein